MADPEQFTPKNKLVTYTGVFVELYKWNNRGQVYEIYEMVELEKMRALTAENPCNLSTHWIIEISSILCSTHIVSRDQNKFVFYVNNYIDWDQFNQLYNLDWMAKGIRNAKVVIRKLVLALIKATNHRLEDAKEERCKREEMVKRWKTEAIAAKRCRDGGGISLSSREKRNHKSNTRDNTDLD